MVDGISELADKEIIDRYTRGAWAVLKLQKKVTPANAQHYNMTIYPACISKLIRA
jgi:hypothetical protein